MIFRGKQRGPQVRIVVSGMPKSGTTAVAKLLGAAAALSVRNDPFNRLDEAGVLFRDALYSRHLQFTELVKEHGRFFAGGVVKDPNFIFFADDARIAFSEAPFVFVLRDPRDNIRSLLNRLNLPGRVSVAPTSFDSVNPTWRRVLEGRTPDVPGADYIERIARRWVSAARAYLDQADWMTLVRYEEFNVAKVETIEGMLTSLGIPGGRSISHLVDVQFQPRGDRGISWVQFFGPDELSCIEETCCQEMRSLGYGPISSGG